MSAYDYGANGFIMVPKKRYKSVRNPNIKEVDFDGVSIPARQIVWAYDSNRKNFTGLIVTGMTLKAINSRTRRTKGTLYFKAFSGDMGLWEISLPSTRLTQIDEDILWYHCEGVHGFTVLKKVGPATDFEDS